MLVEQVAGSPWNGWPDAHGIRGRITVVRAADATNNTSERKLRPSVIQRKVTNGYRAMWAAEAEADVRTAVDTATIKGGNPFAVIAAILA